MVYFDAATAPTLVTKADGSGMWLVVGGTDTNVYIAEYDRASDEWKDFHQIAGPVVERLGAGMLGTQLWLVRRNNADNGVAYGYLTNPADPATFTGWNVIDGAILYGPQISSTGALLYLCCVGTDNRIYWRIYDGAWEAWSMIPTGSTDASPGVAMLDGMNQLYFGVKGQGGTQIYYCVYAGGIYGAWTLIPGGQIYGPTVITDQTQVTYVVVGGGGSQWWCNWNGAGWDGFQQVNGYDKATATELGATLITNGATLELHVVIRIETVLWHIIIKYSDDSVIREWRQIAERMRLVLTNDMTFR